MFLKNETNLFGELFLAQLVEGVELEGKEEILNKTTSSQLYAHDDLEKYWFFKTCSLKPLIIWQNIGFT